MAIREKPPPAGDEAAPTRPPPRVAAPEPAGFLSKAWTDAKRTLKEASRWSVLRHTPYGLTPAILIGLAEYARGFDAITFQLVLPDIVKDLNVRVFSIITAQSLVGFVLIFATIGLAHQLDRWRRVPVVAGGTILASIFAVLTGRSNSVVQLGATRVMDGVSQDAADTPTLSLLADYYPVETRGKMFALVGTLRRLSVATAPLIIGYVVVRWSWRSPFVITSGVLLAVGVAMLLKLREPVRGYMERKALGADEELAERAEDPASFGEAWRTIWGIRTLRRLFIGFIVGGVGDLLFARLIFFFWAQEYGLDAFARGKIFAVRGAISIVGGFIGGGIVDTLVRRRPQRVLVVSSSFSVASAFLVLGLAAQPPLWTLYVLFALLGFTLALTGPARGVFYAQILPAHVRTLGFSAFLLAGIPILIGVQLLAGRADTLGEQWALYAAVPFILVGGLIDLTAASFFPRDMRSALSSQTASEEYRRTKAEGKLKLLVCRDVDVDYDGVQVLFGVDFDLEEGEIIALLGTNGAGKSTLLKAISGIQEAAGGAVVFDGRDITHTPPYEIAGRGVIHMPGGKGIFPGLTVRENLVLGGWMTEGDAENKRRLEEVYEIFPILKERRDSRAATLSGGEQQQLSLAQAFLSKPRLLLIDELSLGLSPAVVQELLESVRRIHASGVTIVVVEQSVNVALTIAQRAIFMEKGEVKFIGKTADLLRRPDILRAVYVKGTGALTEAPRAGVKSERELRAGRLQDARPVLEAQGLSKSFGGIRAVNDVSFALREGEILGLIGPNGAGKTTIFDLISGYVPLDAGKVVYDGTDVTAMGPDQRARMQMVRRFQDARLFPSLTVYEAILVALERKNDVRNMFLTALQIPQVRQSERRVRRRADLLLDLLELGGFRDKFVKELSTGLRRITDIACVLAAEPKVLLLDEPSSGIAQAEAESLSPLLRRVRFETGCSILIIEHDMPLISSLSDDLIALDQGAVVLRGKPDEVLNDPRVIESYLGTSESVIKRSGVLT